MGQIVTSRVRTMIHVLLSDRHLFSRTSYIRSTVTAIVNVFSVDAQLAMLKHYAFQLLATTEGLLNRCATTVSKLIKVMD